MGKPKQKKYDKKENRDVKTNCIGEEIAKRGNPSSTTFVSGGCQQGA